MFDKLIDVVRSLGAAALPFQVIGVDRAAILLRFGRFRRALEPGLLWKMPFADIVLSCDSRVHFYRTNEQSLVTLDGLTVIVSAVISFRVKSAEHAILSQLEFGQSVWDGAAATLSCFVARTAFDDLKNDDFAARLMAQVQAENESYGTEILTCRLENCAKARTLRIAK